ncbi:hypothetical protein Hamer_G012998 [Homarus americanus]|uniref:Uncharacterized protein n=1 Tax=Homarus americanus TaxID=6706 RepID=A0A8J5K5T0_HOMAM|nr:hypothetical protein Hamer_G012998 [Homarus americanus]
MIKAPSLSCVVAMVVLVAALVCYSTTHLPQVLPWFTDPCTHECLGPYFSGRIHLEDPELVPLLKERYLHPPPLHPDKAGFDVDRPPWRELLGWYTIQEMLKNLWGNQAPGVFVEVGAADGEFMSQTLMLEKNYSWTGLLIEPDPRSFRILQERRRNAWTSPVCINLGAARPLLLWLRDLIEGLPQELQGLVMARSKLSDNIVQGDEKQGKRVYVPCLPLSKLLVAANMTQIDLLTIATGTGGDHLKILDVTLNKKEFDVKTLLIQYPRSYLLSKQYPMVPGYIMDMGRSELLVRLYWRTSHCRLLEEGKCRRVKYYDLFEACMKYLCMDFAIVWTVNSQQS